MGDDGVCGPIEVEIVIHGHEGYVCVYLDMERLIFFEELCGPLWAEQVASCAVPHAIRVCASEEPLVDFFLGARCEVPRAIGQHDDVPVVWGCVEYVLYVEPEIGRQDCVFFENEHWLCLNLAPDSDVAEEASYHGLVGYFHVEVPPVRHCILCVEGQRGYIDSGDGGKPFHV